jgi:hypothetical protein
MMMRSSRQLLYLTCIVLLALTAGLPSGAAQGGKSQGVPTVLLQPDLNTGLLNRLFDEANGRMANDMPGARFFGVSITVWPFGNHILKTPTFLVSLRFRKGGTVSAYEWDKEDGKLEFKPDRAMAIGPDSCVFDASLWSDMDKLRAFILYGYAKVSDRFMTHETAAYELNTNALNYRCQWRLWFFREGANIGSFVLEKAGPRID